MRHAVSCSSQSPLGFLRLLSAAAVIMYRHHLGARVSPGPTGTRRGRTVGAVHERAVAGEAYDQAAHTRRDAGEGPAAPTFHLPDAEGTAGRACEGEKP